MNKEEYVNRSYFPLLLAIRTQDADIKIKEAIQNINTKIFNNKLNKKKFSFNFKDKKDVSIECIYIQTTYEVINQLSTNNVLVSNKLIEQGLSIVKEKPEEYNYYFIRRRGLNSLWYLMGYIEKGN